MDTTTTDHHTDCRHISGTGWSCAPQCGRPLVAMAGRVTAAFAVNHGGPCFNGGNAGISVEIWCQSPTGGESDSCIFHLPCRTVAQAEMIASQWQIRWGI